MTAPSRHKVATGDARGTAVGIDAYCVMGNPVEHSRSPWIHARFAELTDQRIDYGRRRVEIGGLAAAITAFRAETAAQGQRASGCNLTIPFKFDAAALVATTTDRALLAGAVNTLVFDGEALHGDNTDGCGLVRDIEGNAGQSLAGRDLLLIGAGGAASGALAALIEARPRRLVVANRTLDKAIALVQRHAALALSHGCTLEAQSLDTCAAQGAFDVVVNASASSLAGTAAPVSAAVLKTGTLALDMMYGPAAAPFLAWAKAHGAVPRDGLGMLVEQAAEAFALWRGARPPAAQVLAELKSQLG